MPRNEIWDVTMCVSNGEEWYRMRSATNPIMMKPAATVLFLPAVNVAADDFVAKVKVVRDPTTGAVPDFYREMQKWNIECMFCLIYIM